MRFESSSRLVGIGAGLFISAACLALDLNRDPTPEEYLFGSGIGFAVENREKAFPAAVKEAGFTFFDGVEQVALEGGKLVFTLTGKRATLGWGNYMGRLPLAEIPQMGQQTIVVRLRLKQSVDRSKWSVRLWRDADRNESTAQAELEGRQWQELEFKPLRTGGANPDGLEFAVEGEEGTRIELEWLKLIQPTYEGYCRTEFVLPEGKIWRAVADVGSANQRHWTGKDEMASRLSINGKLVERRGAKHLYHTDPVDIAPYLKPGRNCVGLYGFRIGYSPFLYFQARIIMESGEIVTVASGKDWKQSPQAPEGWDRPGFDDSSWSNAEGGASPSLTARDAAGRLGIPAYSGRLVISNPGRKDLFYVDTADVVVDVHVPAGLGDKRPTLSYAFGRAARDGTCTPVRKGTVPFSLRENRDSPQVVLRPPLTEKEGSLVYRLNLGRHDRGIYALALGLNAADRPFGGAFPCPTDGKVIEERTREPLAVLHKQTPQPIAGNDYLEGLDLELEDVIDFTDPADPHPWVEARMPPRIYGPVAEKVEKPVIVEVEERLTVENGGLVYREVADPRRGSGFSYRIEFKHPGSFYYLEMEYPDDAKRTIEVSISSKTQGVWTNSQSGVGAETGGRFLPTGKMLKLRWIHVADPGPHSVDVINVVDGEKAAAASLKIYRVRGGLPSVESGTGRSYGIHTERCFYTSGIGMNFGVGTPKNREAAREEDQKLPLMQLSIRDLLWMQETGERYVEYLKFAGQNCHVMGCVQYAEYNTPYVAAPKLDDSRILPCMKTMLANLFDVNGIDFYAGVEFSQSTDTRTYANNAEVAKGADTIWMVDSQGRQRYGHDKVTVVPNWLHPVVQSKYRRLMEDLSRTFAHLGHFRGVHGLMGPTVGAGYWIPALGSGSNYHQPLVASFDDLTMDLFGRESGARLHVSRADPQRFQKRASLVETPVLRRRFTAWRGENVREFFAQALNTLRQERSDLQFVNALGVEDTQFFQYLARSEKPFKEIMREFAIDVDRLSTVEGLWTGRWTLSWRQTHGKLSSQDPYCWLGRTSPDVIAAFPHETNRYVFVRTSWDENMLPTGGYAMKDRNDHDRLVESDWIMNGAKIRALPQPGGYHCREAFIQAIITADPNLLVGGFTDLNVNVGHEQMLRSVLATYTHLPNEKFTPVLDTGLDTNLAIRRLTRAGESWFYVANPCQWHVKGRLELETDGQVTEVPGGRPAAAAPPDGKLELPVSLTPFGLAAYRVSSPGLAVTRYTTEPMAAEELARLEKIPDRVERLLADPQVRLSLSLADRGLMKETLTRVRRAIDDGRYALAWSLMTDYRFWTLWQDSLEKAAESSTGLPARAVPEAPPRGEITYQRERNCIEIIGFPEDQPATMDTILAADKRNGWGKVTYDEATDTYTVDAALWIGDDESNGTFAQIGDRDHSRVTVVTRGTVWIRPPRSSEKRSDGLDSVINRLTLGDPENEQVRATLKIDCETRGQHGLYVGYRSHDSKTWIHGGSLHVYNSTITAAAEDADHAWGGRDYTGEEASFRWSSPGWYASDVRLVGATISWFEGCVAYGAQTGRPEGRRPVDEIKPNEPIVIRGTTFEHGGAAVKNGQHYLDDCTFRHMEAAVAEGGSLSAKLVGCTFEENQANWTLGSMQSGGIVLLDCKVGPQRSPIVVNKNKITPEQAVKRNVPVYPACCVRRSLVVRVVDAAGKPVPEAMVVVTCPEHPEEVTRGATFTDEQGLTPPDPQSGGIVVTQKRYQATDEPGKPATSTFNYEIAVQKKGFGSTTMPLAAGQPIPRPLVIRLQRTNQTGE